MAKCVANYSANRRKSQNSLINEWTQSYKYIHAISWDLQSEEVTGVDFGKLLLSLTEVCNVGLSFFLSIWNQYNPVTDCWLTLIFSCNHYQNVLVDFIKILCGKRSATGYSETQCPLNSKSCPLKVSIWPTRFSLFYM